MFVIGDMNNRIPVKELTGFGIIRANETTLNAKSVPVGSLQP